MTDLIGSVANLTAFRDRDMLDSTVVAVLADWMEPQELAMYRCLGEGTEARLQLRARMTRGDVEVQRGQLWAAVDTLPKLAAHPSHEQALEGGVPVLGVPVERDGKPAQLNLFPLWIDQERFGLVEVISHGAMTPKQQRLVIGVLAIYRNQIGLLDYSERDTLTGLLNRKTFDEQFNKCLSEGAARDEAERREAAADDRRQTTLGSHWLGVIDIDHFKSVNDRFGHLIGDEVLLLIARLLRTSFRLGDRLYRFGGEEFVVLLRAEGREQANVAFERFRTQVEQFRFPQVGQVTASVGFTEVLAVDVPTAAFERADRAVYHAKQTGRNRVHCHERLIEVGDLQAEDKTGDIELF